MGNWYCFSCTLYFFAVCVVLFIVLCKILLFDLLSLWMEFQSEIIQRN